MPLLKKQREAAAERFAPADSIVAHDSLLAAPANAALLRESSDGSDLRALAMLESATAAANSKEAAESFVASSAGNGASSTGTEERTGPEAGSRASSPPPPPALKSFRQSPQVVRSSPPSTRVVEQGEAAEADLSPRLRAVQSPRPVDRSPPRSIEAAGGADTVEVAEDSLPAAVELIPAAATAASGLDLSCLSPFSSAGSPRLAQPEPTAAGDAIPSGATHHQRLRPHRSVRSAAEAAPVSRPDGDVAQPALKSAPMAREVVRSNPGFQQQELTHSDPAPSGNDDGGRPAAGESLSAASFSKTRRKPAAGSGRGRGRRRRGRSATPAAEDSARASERDGQLESNRTPLEEADIGGYSGQDLLEHAKSRLAVRTLAGLPPS